MKIKKDFVTNSSSTSFIIGDLKGDLKELKIIVSKNPLIIVDLFKVLRYELLNEKEVIDNVRQRFSQPYTAEYIRKGLNILNSGGKVYSFHASDQGGSCLEAGLCVWGILNDMVVDSEKVELIDTEGGY